MDPLLALPAMLPLMPRLVSCHEPAIVPFSLTMSLLRSNR
jgi:hypothetical protein